MTEQKSEPVGSFVINLDDEEESPQTGAPAKPSYTPIELTTEIEWARSGTKFYARPCADKFPKLPGGVYRFVSPPQQPWFLERSADRFEFPFKVYNASGDVIARVCTHWAANGGSLGVLANGLRGAGKSVTVKLIANRLRDEMDIPILVVRQPIPLDVIFDNIQQHMIVIFDEFEKSHDPNLYPGAQQRLLSTIDGMSRSEFNRLLLFTTNNVNINENFKDRPSRIHYKFEFSRVSDEIIEGLINDTLPEHLMHFKEDIFQCLNTRAICTIDIVRSIIKEVVTFEESPIQFEEMLNIAKSQPPSFTVSIVEPETNGEITRLSSFWRLSRHEERYAPLLSGNKRSLADFKDKGKEVSVSSSSWGGDITLKLLEPCEEDGFFLANVKVPTSKTFFDKYDFLYEQSFWLDDRPDDWRPLPSPEQIKTEEKQEDNKGLKRQQVYELFNAGRHGRKTLHGTGKPSVYKIKIEPNAELHGPLRATSSALTGLNVDKLDK